LCVNTAEKQISRYTSENGFDGVDKSEMFLCLSGRKRQKRVYWKFQPETLIKLPVFKHATLKVFFANNLLVYETKVREAIKAMCDVKKTAI
jgi:hypothetical protein